MKYFPFLPPALIGLDIQADAVRLVQLRKYKHEYGLEQVAMSKLPEPLCAEGKIKSWERLSSILLELIKPLKLQKAYAAICLPANLVRMQHMPLPAGLSEAEIEAEIYARMQADLPGMTETLCIDFSLAIQVNALQMEVFFTAARRAYLEDYLQCLLSVGLQTKIVDVDVYALRRAACFALGQAVLAHAVYALVHVLGNTVRLIIFNNKEILFGQHWEITESADVGAQVKHKVQLYLSTSRQVEIRELFLCATPECLEVMLQVLTPAWTCQVCQLNPFLRMRNVSDIDATFLAAQAPGFLTACGLAMREVPVW